MLVLLITILYFTTVEASYERKLLNHLLEEKKDKFNNTHHPLERPVDQEKKAVPFVLGGSLYQIIDLDEKNQILVSTWWLDLSWKDYWMTWNPSDFGGIQEIRIPAKKVWLPDVVLYNSANENFNPIYSTNIIVSNDGTMTQIPPGIFSSTCKIDISWFPFDTQSCNLTFGTWSYNLLQIDLKAKDVQANLDSFIDNAEFVLKKASIHSYEYKFDGTPYIWLDFNLTIQRRTIYYFSNLIIPCFLIASLTVFGFYFPPDSGEKLTLQITILMSLTFFMNMVSDMQPPSSDTPIIAVYFSSIMVMVASSVVTTILILNFHHRHSDSSGAMPAWIQSVFLQWLPWMLRMSFRGQNVTRKAISLQTKMAKLEKLKQNDPFPNSLMVNVLDMDDNLFTGQSLKSNQAGNPHLGSYDDIPGSFYVSNTLNIEKNLHSIKKELAIITDKIKEDGDASNVESEWKFAAMVMDRLCLIFFTSFTVAVSAGVLIAAPNSIIVK